MTQVAILCISSSFINPTLFGWRELLYLVVPLPDEWLLFPEVSIGEAQIHVIFGAPILLPPMDMAPSGSKTGALFRAP